MRKTKRCAAFATLLGVVFASGAALHAEAALTPKKIELYANYETVSITVWYEGDDEGNAQTAAAFRPVGTTGWRPAQPLARIRGERFAGCLFGLSPDTAYEVKVTFTDPDGAKPAELTATTKTRRDEFPSGTGTTTYVSPRGDDASPGTKEKPFRTIQHAVDRTKPGDVVVVTPGTYRETVRIRTSGRPDAYITLRGEPGAVVTGAESRYEGAARPRMRMWTHLEGDLYRTTPGFAPRYVAAAGGRLYFWKDLEMLKRGSETLRDRDYAVKGGWTCDKADGTLTVRLPDGGDPENLAGMQVARYDEGIVLDGVHHVIIDGLDVGFFGNYCVALGSSSDCVVRNSRMHNARNGMILRGPTSHNNLIEGNEFFDTSVWDWPWQMCKAHDPEGSAVFLSGGRGTVVRRNRVHGFFNAIVPSMWGRLDDERFNADLDVHHNEIWDTGDDCMEPEGTCINQRYWSNRMRGALMGISLAPITVGPCWCIRNTVFNHHLSGVKLASNSSGPVFLYHNTFVTTVHDTDRYRARKDVNGIGVSGPYHNLTFRNNIIQGTDYVFCDWRGERPRGLSMDYDNLFTTSTQHFFMLGRRFPDMETTRRETGFEKNGLNVDARFVDLEKGDLRLRPDSPLIDRGVPLANINDDFAGKAPDIGAHEHR